MRPQGLPFHRRNGVTLVELLVVITLILAMTAAAVPLVHTLTRDQESGQAERSIHSYLNVARTRAIESGRPAGVLIQRDSKLPNAGMSLYQVEVPDSYCGDLSDSRVQVTEVTTNSDSTPHWPYYSGATTGVPVWKVQLRARDFWSCVDVLRYGDHIRFEGSGPWYVIVKDTVVNASTDARSDFSVNSKGFIQIDDTDLAKVDANGWMTKRWLTIATDQYVQAGETYTSPGADGDVVTPVWSGDKKFEIRRQPIPTSAPPLRLPTDTVIDLASSGTESSDKAFAQTSADDIYPVILLFNTTGELDRVYAHNQENVLTEPVYLLVGSRARAVTPLPEDNLENWQDVNNVWIAVSSKSGRANAASVAANPTDILDSRRLVRKLYLNLRGS